MSRFLVLAAIQVAILGCSQQPQAGESPQSDAPATVAVQTIAVTPSDSIETAEFAYPDDLGGRALEKAVAPDLPAVPPAERLVLAPRPRTLPARLLTMEFVAGPRFVPTPVLPANSVFVRLASPVERVPLDLGNGARSVPAKPTLPVAAPVTARSRDVNLPPPLPTLGRPMRDRASLDDPTSEIGNTAIASQAVKVPAAPASFLRVFLPNPFELAEQVKPNVAAAAEPALIPVPVDPRRVK